MSEWTSIKALAEGLGVSRRTIERALRDSRPVELGDGRQLEIHQRDATPEEYDAGLDPRTRRVVCATAAGLAPPAAVTPPRAAPESATADETVISREVERALTDPGRTANTITWLEGIKDGTEVRDVVASTGVLHKGVPWTDGARLSAGMNAEKLRDVLAERERLFIPRETVSEALVGLASLLTNRLNSMPPRMADQLLGAKTISDMRERLRVAIDEIRTELGDAAERQLVEILGE